MNDVDLGEEQEVIHKSGCNGAPCHAQMYTMGTGLRHGNDVQMLR